MTEEVHSPYSSGKGTLWIEITVLVAGTIGTFFFTQYEYDRHLALAQQLEIAQSPQIGLLSKVTNDRQLLSQPQPTKLLQFNTYRDPQGQFTFNYPKDETVVPGQGSYDPLKIDPGQKKIAVYVGNQSSDVCATQCYPITFDGREVPVHFDMTGDYHAGFNLPNGKRVEFSLSCDSRGSALGVRDVFCFVSKARVQGFVDALATFTLLIP